ncbi:MAG: class I SAM-dependent methyltransferase [Oligoflexia bacterium]|nr:class I SAM-dependent methyltransferase [Oligoflexia bacterium]
MSEPFPAQPSSANLASSISEELRREYDLRFSALQDYRVRVWKILTAQFFQQYIPRNGAVLDLGCGWGEFINQIEAAQKFGMDLNPESARRLAGGIQFLQQDCSQRWSVPDNSLDAVFTSNFFEHLPSKAHLKATLIEAYRALKPGGKLICMGPNIKCIPGAYWDFWDHYLELTELSLREGLELTNFRIHSCIERFLPYTMVNKRPAPLWLVRFYLRLPWLWRFFGAQFLVIGTK